MGRTLKWWRLAVSGFARGAVSVATSVTIPGLGRVSCPAAPVIAATVRRLGHPVRSGHLAVAPHGDSTMYAVTWQDRAGDLVGLAVAADRGDPRRGSAARDAVEAWAAVLRTRRIQLADTEPMCQGARRAIDAIERAAQAGRGPVYVLGQPVATRGELAAMRQHGAMVVDSVDQIPAESVVVFPAAGVSAQARAGAAARHLQVTDATCPLVASAHAEIRRFADSGDSVVIVGSDTGAAADGFAGQAPASAVRVASVAEVSGLQVADPDRVAFVVQTGTVLEQAAPVITALRTRWSVRGPHPDDWCYAASDRAGTVRAAATGCDLVVVLGDRRAADTRELVELAGQEGPRVHAVDSAAELLPAWLADASTVGIAVSLSARRGCLEDTVETLAGLGPVGVVRRQASSQVTDYSYRPC